MDALDRDGFAIVEDALSAEQLERLTVAVDRVWRERRPDGAALHELSFLALDDAFLEPLDQPAVLRIIAAALGWNVYVYHCHLDVHPPAPPDGAWRWHQDGGRQNVDVERPRPRLSVKAGYFLTDVTASERGAMWVVRGSHRSDELERPPDGSRLPPGAEPLLVRAGSAVVFDRRLWHARGDNTSDVTRKAIFYAYTYRWIRPRDPVGLDPDRIRRLDPVRRQLVGWATGDFGCWFPTDEDVPLRSRVR